MERGEFSDDLKFGRDPLQLTEINLDTIPKEKNFPREERSLENPSLSILEGEKKKDKQPES